ncbi:hypothetical protein KDE13_07625 [Campylobacter sp. faydin G-140]|uniref:hypothetical protein n=1 Tax=Campylobacter anatolicus TaxID=2829105 RepID=UPI001B8E20EE|nr:hypothetical protein [Campylobacter anatolicus]MBR8466207.1 hypothetical protein [Campylobacter anatolicus]
MQITNKNKRRLIMDKIYTLHFDFKTDGGADFFKNVSNFINSIDELNAALCGYIDHEITTKVKYEFSPDDLDDVITQKSQFQGSFIIKKPDLAGASKWTIIHDKAIDVKIIDEAWITKLKSHEIALRYGDRISGTLITNSFIDKDLNVIDTDYFLDDILEVSSQAEQTQQVLKL